MTKSIMVQGTASSVGKSIVTAGICRLLLQDGYKVAPFKSQNMALNSYITSKGHEMGRAQVVQAEAAGIEADVLMNPILLKPSTDKKAQVIINGKVYRNMSASEYHEHKPQLKEMVHQTYKELASAYEYIVIEGAGSPAEINLREGDLVNMGMAEISDSPVILVGDIDRGGVFASLYGTVMLLTPEERERVVGLVINKFRGDVEILKPGLKMIEDLVGIPVLGVLPYSDIRIEDEDSLAERFRSKRTLNVTTDIDSHHEAASQNNAVVISVLYLPHVSNFTDFNIFETMPDVDLQYIMRGESIGEPDVLIIPGSKNTIEDLLYLHRSGLSEQILRLARRGVTIVGICGGYQMLGELICDPYGTESSIDEINGLGLLATRTVFEQEKTTTQVKGQVISSDTSEIGLFGQRAIDIESPCMTISGYEIHMGQTDLYEGATPLFELTESLGNPISRFDGAINSEGNVWGTYVHGIFDDVQFTRQFVNGARHKKGLSAITTEQDTFAQFKEKEYDKLADMMRQNLDWKKLMTIIEKWHADRMATKL